MGLLIVHLSDRELSGKHITKAIHLPAGGTTGAENDVSILFPGIGHVWNISHTCKHHTLTTILALGRHKGIH